MKHTILFTILLLIVSCGNTEKNKNPLPTPTKAELKVRLYDSSTDLMSTELYDNYSLPKVSPYESVAVNETNFNLDTTNLATSSKNKLVDWVLVSLIDTGATIVQTRSGLVQADGDIVGLDGISPLEFTVNGNFHIGIKHRNHLGIKTSNVFSIKGDALSLDFTNNSVPLYGSYNLIPRYGYYVMIGGDANNDGSIDALDLALWESQNGLWGEYLGSDFNLDGSVDAVDQIQLAQFNGLYQEW